jgi:glutamate--cysteine ligase
VAKKFAKLLGMDPWLIYPMTGTGGEVDFASGTGLDSLQTQADALLTKVRRKYKEYGINEKPFVVVKADTGSHGFSPFVVRDAKDLADPARRGRNHSATGDASTGPVSLIVQEGVPTYERVNDAVAEPVVYMIDRYVVGGFYRVHAERGVDDNLEAPGASYVPLAFAESHHLPRRGDKPGVSAPNRFYMYGVIGRLAMLAASYELEATDPDAEVYE